LDVADTLSAISARNPGPVTRSADIAQQIGPVALQRDHSDAVLCFVRLADEFGSTRQIAAIQGELFQARALLLMHLPADRCEAYRVIAQ